MKTHSQIADDYIKYCIRNDSDPEKDETGYRAWEVLHVDLRDEPNELLKAIDEIMAKTDTAQVFANLGAGAIENLLKSDAGPEYLPKLFERARQNRGWNIALASVWTSGFKNREIAEAIEAWYADGRPEGAD